MIHSRDYARIYVKQLRRSVPDRALSPEEIDVVAQALATTRTGKPDAADEVEPAAAGVVRPAAGAVRPAAPGAVRPATNPAAADEPPRPREPA
jgi:hypothetical protein